ncbi:MAG: peptidase prepilin type [Marmoricola sp.]|nr:peptidase prepilin type [Marmoricola sp.]
MEWLGSAAVGLVVSGGLGALSPRWIARIPEPVPEAAAGPGAAHDDTDASEASTVLAEPIAAAPTGSEATTFHEATRIPGPTGPSELDGPSEPSVLSGPAGRRGSLAPPPPKQPYAEIAAAPGTALRLAGWSGLVGAAFGGVLGWTGALLYLLPLVPVGVALLVIDWRTTLLPTRVIHPTYAALALLVPLAALVDRDIAALYRAGLGWLLLGGWFWIFWAVAGAWGFGDVRLSRVLGPALGFLGWPQLLVGAVLMLILGGLGGVVLAARDRSLRKRFPYGPFMLVGAAIGGVAGPWLASGLGY